MAKKVLAISKIATSQEEFAELLDVRTIEKTGNYVLVFENSEVIMPGQWRLNRDLYIGDSVAAYWAEDDEGRVRFHLEWEEDED